MESIFMNQKILYLLEDYDIYKSIDDNIEILFHSKESTEEGTEEYKKVMRFTFNIASSIFNKKYPSNKRDDLKVFHFKSINNVPYVESGEYYLKYVNKGFMTASFCYLILQLLQDKRLSDIDFEINLLNVATIIEDGKQVQAPNIYDKLLDDTFDNNVKFRVFFIANRKQDILYYQNLLDSKNIEIKIVENKSILKKHPSIIDKLKRNILKRK